MAPRVRFGVPLPAWPFFPPLLRSLVLGSTVLCLALVASACQMPNAQGLTDQRYDNLMHEAKSELYCEDVKHSYLGSGVHVVVGCGKRVSYVLYCHKLVCRWVQNPGELAVATMACPPARIAMKRVSQSTYSFEGCGERQTYRLYGLSWRRERDAREPEVPVLATETRSTPPAAETSEPRPADELGELDEVGNLDTLD